MRRKKKMMKAPSKLTPSEVAKALPLPKVGEVIKGKKVRGVKVVDADSVGRMFTIGILFEKGVRRKEVPAMLMKLLNSHHITTPKGDFTIGNKDYQLRPTKNGVQVILAMELTPAIYTNPGKKKKLTPLEDFDEQYTKMAVDTPEKYFRVFKCPPFNGPAFRGKLWSFVGYMGENYGYCDNDNIYHRRASLVMPKIKITKAPIGAKMMYHTHPRKDEPSLSSPDDYLLYFDLSMPPRSIRHFFTVMADRIDYFHITPKKDAKGKFVRVSEDKFIDELDAQMSEFEKKHDAKYQKGTMQDDLRFCEAITKDVVKWLNKKYGSYVTIKYKCYYKARKNPPEPEFDDLHLGDEFIAKAIQDIRDGDYTWPEFSEEKKPQDNYAYWFTQYYFMEDDRDRQLQLLSLKDGRKEIQWAVKHRTKQLGLGPSRLRVINHYLDAMPHPEYSNYDMLNLLSLHYDIMASDESIRDGTGSKSRIEDMAKEMEIPDEVRDDLLIIEEARSLGPYTEEAKTLSGDFYPLLILSNLSIEAVQIMKSVASGLMSIEQARHDVYHRKKDRALNAIDEFLLDYQRKYNRSDREILGMEVPGRFRGAKLNPPPFAKKSEFEASIPPEDITMVDIVIEALEKFAPYEEGKQYLDDVRSKLYMRVPGGGTTVSVGFSLTTGKMQMFIPAKGYPLPEDPSLAAMEAYQEIIRTLNEYGLNVANEELEVATMVAANPRGKQQVILIAGASGSGKSTTIRNLLQALPNSKVIPSYTTRQKRKSDKPGEKIFVTEKKFKEMEAAGEFAESARLKNGNFYGRKADDFKGVDYAILDVTLTGYDRYKELYPSAYGAYLETTAKPKQVYQLLLRRGQMSPQEARKRSSIIPSHIRDSKKRTFDIRIKSIVGKYDDIALEILDKLPRNNPGKMTGAQYRAGIAKLLESGGKFTPEYLRRHPKTLFVFGDNDTRKGKGGQAVNRDEPNAVGFRTKHKPTTSKDAYYSDDNYEENIRKMQEDLDNIKQLSANYDSVVFMPRIGEGRAALRRKAPKTYEWMKANLPRNNPAYPSKYYNPHLYASGSRDPFFPGDVPVAPPELLRNPSKKITSVRIEESPNKEKKMVAYFFDDEGNKVRTTHFGARGMSDFTQHKDPERMKRYLARHGKMGEDWKDPTTAGALSRWILWGKPGLRDSFNDYKKRFNLQGTMTVTNTRMNANRVPKKYEGQDPSEHSDLFTDEDPKGTIQGLGFKDKETAERSINIIKRSGKTHAHKMQAAMAMEQRARFHAHQTPGIRAGQKVYAKFIEEMKEKTKSNPMAPGYQSYAWTTQDWRSIKVNNKGDIDYSKKCGAEDTQVADGTPRLCLPAEVVRTLMKSDKGKDILRTQARKKARAKKGQRVPWHPRIKEIWKRVEDKTVKDRPNPNPDPAWRHGKAMSEEEDPFASMFTS